MVFREARSSWVCMMDWGEHGVGEEALAGSPVKKTDSRARTLFLNYR